MYTVKAEAKFTDEISWRCVKRQSTVMCTAVLKTNKLYEKALLVNHHSHPVDQTAVPVEQCRQSMKRKASTTNDKPHQIFAFSVASAPNEVNLHSQLLIP